MTLIHKSGRLRAALLGVCVLAAGACDSDLTNPTSNVPDAATLAQPVDAGTMAFATTGTGGIPFGFFHQPTSEYASYNGALRGISAPVLLSELETARKAGARVIVSLVGSANNWVNANGTFSFEKWKGRLTPFRSIDFSSYIADGTIVGHYMMDEPNDPTNWNGQPVTPAQIEEMAMYSKQLWPTMPTIVRVAPSYLRGHTYHYLDAAWAQYHYRFGNISAWLTKNVGDAKASGLALVTGVNTIAGGSPADGLPGYYMDEHAMSAAELLTWGSAILAEPYACAFVSWRYNEHYQARTDIKNVLAALSGKARNHAARPCRGGAQTSPPPVKPPPPPPPGTPPPPPPPPVVTPPSFTLTASSRIDKTGRYITLQWSDVAGATVGVYRDGKLRITTANDGRYTNFRKIRGPATYVYKVCRTGTTKCSNTVSTIFK